ncbi:TPA: hypothetical protein ACF3XI_004633, partial [Vibrio parahaemolyticus]
LRCFVSILKIDDLELYFEEDGFHPEKVNSPPYPMVVLRCRKKGILAAIKFRHRSGIWHVDNVRAIDGYGPTVYKVLMQLSGCRGIAPCYKASNQPKEFIVKKSKRIWENFYNHEGINVEPIENGYKENYLNSKYSIKVKYFNLEPLLNSFEANIEKEFSKVSLATRIKRFFLKPEDIHKMKVEFRKLYLRNFHEEVTAFLKPSVEVHAK